MATVRARMTVVEFEHHLPDCLRRTAQNPNPILWKAVRYVHDVQQIDDVQACLRRDHPAIVGTSPSRGIHPRATRICGNQEGVAMTGSAILLKVELHVTFDADLGELVCYGSLGSWRVRDSEHKLRQCVAFASVRQPKLVFIVGGTVVDVAHRRRQTPVNQHANALFGIVE